MEVKVFGQVFGTASGWDDVDYSKIVYYDFVPTQQAVKSFGIPKGDTLFADLDNGFVEVQVTTEDTQRFEFDLALKKQGE